MNATKKYPICLILLCLLSILGITPAFAGPTQISGTMSCIMPTSLELNARGINTDRPPYAAAGAPTTTGAGGAATVQKEVRQAPSAPTRTTQDPAPALIAQEETSATTQTTVYTVCAK